MDLDEEECWRSLKNWGLGPDGEVHYYNFGCFEFFFLRNGTHLYIQHELPISFAPVNKHNVMDYSDRMGSACVCSEAGLAAKRPFRDLLTEEGKLLKIFLQVSCWPSAASLAFKCYLSVVPKTKAISFCAEPAAKLTSSSLPKFYHYIYLPLYLHWEHLQKKPWNGFHACLHLVAAFLAAAIRPRGRQHLTVGRAIPMWSKETVPALQFSHFN